jgi:hypothetical protein
MKFIKTVILIISLIPSFCLAQSNDKTINSIFSGKVISISEENLKEGTFSKVKIEVDSILQIDTVDDRNFNFHPYLTEYRIKKHNDKKPLIVTLLIEPELCELQVCMRYIIYTHCCNVDYYYYDPKKTKRLEK